MSLRNLALLCLELAVYFGVLATLFHVRRTIGLGVFVTALGTMHFLETYLAAVLYVGLPGGIVVSPGSTVLFAGKLVLLLLVYVKEDAATVRQPIYGLLAGNALMIGLVLLLRHHAPVAAPGRSPDFTFIDDMGWLMVWGSLLLYVDSLAVVLVYERLGRAIRPALRIWIAAALVLSFDQVMFYGALRFLFAAPLDVLLGGWIGKMASAAGYALLAGLYLRFVARSRPAAVEPRLRDLFQTLTYRERYHVLLAESGRDGLTGALNRNRLEVQGREAVNLALTSGQTASVVLVDLDRFKAINDEFGHPVGDEALRRVAAAIQDAIRPTDYLFRYGGDEFLVASTGLSPQDGVALAERLGASIAAVDLSGVPRGSLGASVGVATGPAEGGDYDRLLAAADARLYAAKRIGRNRAASLEQMLSAAARVQPRRRAGVRG